MEDRHDPVSGKPDFIINVASKIHVPVIARETNLQ